jgi:arabinose-5-phosphate isomerase
MNSDNILEKAREVFDIEVEALLQVKDQLDNEFTRLVQECVRVLDSGGKIVLSGVGKSGHIGKKLAATLASTGSPAVFMHPVEALHGDLGILQKTDILLALSYSGETDELLAIIPSAKRFGVPVVAITGGTDSGLAELSDITVKMTVSKEACPFNLAPTATAVALLALGDALAIVLLKVRGFTKEDYGRFHPGGSIGRAVTMRVSDVMRSGDRLAVVGEETTVKETLLAMTKARCGSAIIADSEQKLAGIFTDGDFRRHAEEDLSVLSKKVSEVMTANPASLKADMLAVEIMKMIETRRIDDIVVLDSEDKVVGLVDIQDLPGLKLM